MARSTSSGWTMPSAFFSILIAVSPLSAHVAGLVPWALSGMNTFLGERPCDWWKARIIMIPVSSPCAPAEGWSEQPSIPLTSQSMSASLPMISRVPCASASGVIGWRWRNPGIRAAHSLILGLYFMVHDPSG